MATVGVDDGSLQADSQPKSVGLVWALVATWWLSLQCIFHQITTKGNGQVQMNKMQY